MDTTHRARSVPRGMDAPAWQDPSPLGQIAPQPKGEPRHHREAHPAGIRREVPDRDDRCDRCAHKLREHAGPALGSICQVGRGRDTRRLCPCDGFTVEEKLA